MKLERSNINFPMWRKKVDSSLLSSGESPIPKFLWEQWDIEELFNNSKSRKDELGIVSVSFKKKTYSGSVYRMKSGQFRFIFEKPLRDKLKETYVMSYMRYVEDKLRSEKSEYQGMRIEDEIPFWEFLDLEFDAANKAFYLDAHYVQKPNYFELFKEIVNSHILLEIEEMLSSKEGLRIIKEKWKTKESLKSQIDAKNVIYYLIDNNSKKFYIGEAESLVNRLIGHRKEIPNWTHYRFDSLPNGLTKQQRVAIERLMIRAFASFLPNSKGIDSMGISEYNITNKKIDS
jgi:hypothetical protein